jgi:hypothetical protein
MKTKLLLQTPAAILFFLVSLAAPSQPAVQIDPTTGLPVRAGVPVINPATGLPLTGSTPAPAIDPNTGLPIAAPAEPQWIDSNWRDPNIVLTNLSYDHLPVSEVAKDLRERFKNDFDILPMPTTYGQDWGNQIDIQLQLRNVKASDVFNAMNLVFENDRTPVRWELKFNGNRPVALLRVLPEGAPQPVLPSPKPADTHRMVFFIGNLLGDEKSGGMTMDQIIKTIYEIWPSDFGKPEGIIQFHNDAQLLVVNGTRDQIDFIQQTLNALRQKANADFLKKANAGSATDIQKSLDLMRQRELDQTQNTQKAGSGGGQ